jgi:metallophosphoesterase superfamily enzyme
LRWRGLRVPCFLVASDRIILPAFSRDASGVNVLREPSLFGYRCAVIADNRVLDFGPVEGLERRLRHCQINGAGTQGGPARVQERNRL